MSAKVSDFGSSRVLANFIVIRGRVRVPVPDRKGTVRDELHAELGLAQRCWYENAVTKSVVEPVDKGHTTQAAMTTCKDDEECLGGEEETQAEEAKFDDHRHSPGLLYECPVCPGIKILTVG